MKSTLFFFALLLTGLAQAQDVKKTRTISGITRLKASMGIDVSVKVGDTESLHIEAQNVPEDKIIIEQNGDELVLKMALDVSFERKPRRSVKAYLTVRQLRSVDANSGASVMGETPFVADRFELSSKAGASVKLDLKANELVVTCNSGGSAKLDGSANSLSVSASSGGDLDAGSLIAQTVDATASSGGSVRVNAQKELFGKASVGGSVSNRGPGRTVSKRTSLGGSVN